jgi:ADP-ribosylglycohydrolase
VALRAFLESRDWEHAVRLAVSMGGDSDTLACITGGIAQAFYSGVPEDVEEKTRRLIGILAPSLLEVVDEFLYAYMR